GAERRNRKDRFLQDRFAPGDDEIGPALADERLGAGGVRRRDDAFGPGGRRKRLPQFRQLARLPAAIRLRPGQPVKHPEREHVDEAQGTDPRKLAADSLPQPAPILANDDGAGERRKRTEPAREPFPVEGRTIVSDEESPHMSVHAARGVTSTGRG